MNLSRFGTARGLPSTAADTLGSAIKYASALADSTWVPHPSRGTATDSSSQSTTAPPPAPTIAALRLALAAEMSASNAATLSSNPERTSWLADDSTDVSDCQSTEAATPVCLAWWKIFLSESPDFWTACSMPLYNGLEDL